MLEISILDFLLRALPEAFLFIMASYTITGRKLDRKSFISTSVILGFSIYFVRRLPIHFGIHTILLIMIYTFISVTINKINVIKAMSAVLTCSIILYICEAINIIFLEKILKLNIDTVFLNEIMRNLYGSPSLLLFLLINILAYRKLSLRHREF